MVLVSESLYKKDKVVSEHGRFEAIWKEFEAVITPKLTASIDNATKRAQNIEDVHETLNLRIDALQSFIEKTKLEREERKKENLNLLLDRSLRDKTVGELQANARKKGVELDEGQAIVIVRKMAEEGWGRDEALLIYAIAPAKVTDLYQDYYKKTKLGRLDRYAISYMAETTAKKTAYINSRYRGEMEKAVRDAKITYITSKLDDINVRIKEALSKGLSAEESEYSDRSQLC